MSKQVKIIIQNNQQQYLLLKRADTETSEHYGNWECPGGKLEKDENFKQAAIREAKEETNLDITIIKTVKEIVKNDELFAVVFLASAVETTHISISNEHSAYGWFTYKELINLEPITYKKFFLELIDLSKQ